MLSMKKRELIYLLIIISSISFVFAAQSTSIPFHIKVNDTSANDLIITVWNPETKEVCDFYMDDKLKRQVDNKIKRALNVRDEDYVIIVDGNERVGKSVFAMQLGKYIDPTLKLSRICFTPDEFRKAILEANKGQCVIFDEAYRGLAAKGALTEMNRILVSLMMEMGQKNLFVIIVLPTIHLVEKYVALWRARGLFHIFRKKGTKGYWRFFNKRKILPIYLKGRKDYGYNYAKSGFKGRFYNRYVINESSYRSKKSESLRKGYKSTRQEKYKEHRDRLICLLKKKLNLSLDDMVKLFKQYNIPLKKDNNKQYLIKNRISEQKSFTDNPKIPV